MDVKSEDSLKGLKPAFFLVASRGRPLGAKGSTVVLKSTGKLLLSQDNHQLAVASYLQISCDNCSYFTN